MAGKSTRFPGTRPKALLTHPYGCSMLTASLVGVVNNHEFDNIYIVALQEQLTKDIMDSLAEEIVEQANYVPNIKFVGLSSETKSQPETIYRAIIKEEIKGSMFIKDCDNQFTVDAFDITNNGIAIGKLGDYKIIPGNKNYVQLDQFGNISNIVEKQIISDTFGCGGYYFKDIDEFIQAYEALRDNENLYTSHLLYYLIAQGKVVKPISTRCYLDWGTLEDWLEYTSQFKTIFIDLDGVITKNTGKLTTPNWHESEINEDNANKLRELDLTKTAIIITTSRPEEMREETLQLLEENKIPYSGILFGLMHCKRILINDYAITNPYPSASAMSIPRDSQLTTLKDL